MEESEATVQIGPTVFSTKGTRIVCGPCLVAVVFSLSQHWKMDQGLHSFMRVFGLCFMFLVDVHYQKNLNNIQPMVTMDACFFL